VGADPKDVIIDRGEPTMRITKARQRRMVPNVDALESRQLMSLMLGHHHGHAPRHPAVTPRAHGHHGHTATAGIAVASVRSLNLVTSPKVTGSVLNATAAIAPNDIWAVGASQTVNSDGQTLIEHFNGTSWSVIPSSNLTGGLYGVAGVASNDVWAVGRSFPSGSLFANALIEHWNGSNWSVFPTPQAPQGSQLYAVTAIASNNVWAVGVFGPGTTELVEHFDGTQWSIVASPAFLATAGLLGISATSSTDVWAVGETDWMGDAGPNPAPEALQFDGKSWSRAVVPAPPKTPFGSGLLSVAAVAPNNVWAVGFGTAGKDPNIHRTALIERFDGTQWSIVTSPVSGAASLAGISAISANDIWAVGSVGSSSGVDQTLTLHFDGTRWSVITSPNATSGNNDLLGVSTLPGGTVVAVGSAASSPAFGSDVNGLILQN
jgi:hypothetical protein